MKKGKILILVTCLVVSLVAIYAFRKPAYNWDLFPYLALTIESTGRSFDSIHYETYQLAAAHMPPEDFEAVSARQPVLMDNPSEFERILGFFRVKKGFIAAIRGIHALGLNAVVATYILSPISYCVLGWILIFWVARYFSTLTVVIIILGLMLMPFLLQTARYSSPDLPSALLLIAGTALILDSRLGIGLFLGVISMTLRPDAVLHVEVMVVALLISRVIHVYGAVAITLGLSGITWWLFQGPYLILAFLFTSADYSSEWEASEMWHNYSSSLIDGLPTLASPTLVVSFLAGLASLKIRSKTRPLKDDVLSLIVIGLMIALVIRYLMHPLIEDRFLIATYLIWIVAFLRSLSEHQGIKSRIKIM